MIINSGVKFSFKIACNMQIKILLLLPFLLGSRHCAMLDSCLRAIKHNSYLQGTLHLGEGMNCKAIVIKSSYS